MATYDLMQTLDKHFQDNWATTAIQFPGKPLNDKSLVQFIALEYNPVANAPYAMDGSVGRIEYAGLYVVRCYAKTPVKVFKLADAVKTFLNGKQLNDVTVGIGQDGVVNDLQNGLYALSCNFSVSQWA